MPRDPDHEQITFGQRVYAEDGTELGTVRGFDEHGFYVSTDEGIAALSSEHLASDLPGEAELMWRCWSCGEMGQIEQLPEECPACGAPKEDIYYWKED